MFSFKEECHFKSSPPFTCRPQSHGANKIQNVPCFCKTVLDLDLKLSAVCSFDVFFNSCNHFKVLEAILGLIIHFRLSTLYFAVSYFKSSVDS